MRPRIRIETDIQSQLDFWHSPACYRGYIGGIRSGKTWAGTVEAMRQPAGSVGCIMAPTYPMMTRVVLPKLLTITRQAQMLVQYHAAEWRVELVGGITIWLATAEKYDRIRGTDLGWAWLDEARMMSLEVWNVMVGRLSEPPGRAWMTTTPYGLGWLYDLFSEPDDDYAMVRARTRDNPYLPAAYVERVTRRYSEQYARQELDGEFVDLDAAGLFRASALQTVEDAPADLPRARGWDLAATHRGGDWTVGVLMSGPDSDGRWYVLDVCRGQWEPAERDKRIRQTAEQDGTATRIRMPQDPGQAGKSQARSLRRLLAGYAVTIEPVTGSKATRAEPFAGSVNAGMVSLVRGPWCREYTRELDRFPLGGHDDQVDASADAYEALTRRPAVRIAVA